MLRHPVVITSIEEDFKKIGLLREDAEAAEEIESEEEEQPEEASASASADEFDDDIDEDEDDDSEVAESLEFMEKLARRWDEETEFDLTDEEMAELESLGESVTFIPEDDELSEDDDEGNLDEDEIEEGRRRMAGKRGMVRTKKMSAKAKMAARRYYKAHKLKIGKQRRKRAKTSHGRRLMKIAKSFEDLASTAVEDDDVTEGRRRIAGKSGTMRTKRMSSAERMAARKYYKAHKMKIGKQRRKRAKTSHGMRLVKLAKAFEDENLLQLNLNHIEDLVADLGEDLDMNEAQAAFANIALVAEMLADLFESAALTEDEDGEDLSEMANDYADIAMFSADAVEYFEDEDPEDLDESLVQETYQDVLGKVLEGLSVFSEDEEDDTEGNE